MEQNIVSALKTDPAVNMLMRQEIDKNISNILEKSQFDFSMLYNHPKLMHNVFNRGRSRPIMLTNQKAAHSNERITF